MQKAQYTASGSTTDWQVGVLKDPAGNHNAYASYAYDGDTCYIWHRHSTAESDMRMGVKETKNGAFIGTLDSSICKVQTATAGGQYYRGLPYRAKSSAIESEFGNDLAEWVITGLNNRSSIVIYYGYPGTTYYYEKGINSPKKTTYEWKEYL